MRHWVFESNRFLPFRMADWIVSIIYLDVQRIMGEASLFHIDLR